MGHDVRLSKFLSLVLRHKPGKIGIELDEQGWVDIDVLLEAVRRHGRKIDRAALDAVVENNDKKRFVIRDGRIRANQGHSLEIDLALAPVEPPALLYHGTAEHHLEGIRERGLVKMNRQHVHLSADVGTAEKVGSRHGKAVVLLVDAARMAADGHSFFLSDNGVWLTDHVPWAYLER